MRRFSKIRQQVSFRKAATFSLAVIVVPLFVATILFDVNTFSQQQSTLRNFRQGTLELYRSQWEETLEVTEDFLMETAANDTEFSMVLYAKSKTNVHVASESFNAQCKTLLRSRELLGAFFLYSAPYDYYRLIYTSSYPQEDLLRLREAVTQSISYGQNISRWSTVKLSDRTVLLFTYVCNNTVIAAMVDSARLNCTGLEENGHIFFAMPDGTPYASLDFKVDSLPVDLHEGQIDYCMDQTQEKNTYELTSLPLSRNMGSILYASPLKSFWQQLNISQIILLAITVVLLGCIPLCWFTLRRLLLEPVGSLSRTMRAIQGGGVSIRVPQNSRIAEVNQISDTVNTMLDTIHQQKIDAYEQKLATQNAQLQYLHLQIRPHFFLNCLNLVYSLAGEKKYESIQDLVLDLSTYLRSIFKDGSQLVPLKAELSSVESYMRIQQAGTKYPPQLRIDVDADASQALVPSLSLLTFVENSIKHSRLQGAALEMRIRCSLLGSEDGRYLNVTISDNGGGFTEEQLQKINGKTSDTLYADLHVGISNIQHRLQLMYGGKATVTFRNLSDGACVEIFLPVNVDTEEEKRDDCFTGR